MSFTTYTLRFVLIQAHPFSKKKTKKKFMGKISKKAFSAKNNQEEMVITPGGLRPKSKVHFIEPGYHVTVENGVLKKMHTITGKVVKDFEEVQTAHAEMQDRRLSFKPEQENIDNTNAPGIAPPPVVPGTGWIVNSGWTNDSGTPISYFKTKWKVPPAPATQNNQLIYLFSGIQQTASGPYILQPVLQWGSSPAGGGNYWAIANWYVNGSAGIALHGSLVQVNEGDELEGIMTLTGQSGTLFNYNSSFKGQLSADLQVTNVDELKWANETLECYGLTAFSDYPNTPLTAFTDIEIKTGSTEATINWDAQNRITDNGQHCEIVSNDSPGGAVYLYYKQNIQNVYFVVDKSTYGKDEVMDISTYPNAFWIIADGFTIDEINGATPQLSGAFTNIPGISITPNATGPEYELPGDADIPQRIRFPYDIHFSSASLASFPSSGSGPVQEVLNTTLNTVNDSKNAITLFELVAGANPYFVNVDPNQDNAFYLSQDLRIFTATPGINNIPVSGGPAFNSDSTPGAFSYIQDLLSYLNNNYSSPGATDPFNGIFPDQAGALTGDSSVTPWTLQSIFPLSIKNNYNFAIARVRLRGTSGSAGAANNVKVFFRLWSTQTADTDYQPSSTYLSNTDAQGFPDSPQVGAGNNTIPFFATGNFASNNDYATGGINNRTITINSGDSVWAYFGCFLNLYDTNNIINGSQVQALLNGTHHCLVAQLAYDDAPIVNSNGVTMSPENSDKLAQRNLQITLSDNPGPADTHRIPQTFDLRPTPGTIMKEGRLIGYPDELMIDWHNVPVNSMANIYWPQVNASEVLQLASQLYGTHLLSAADANTIQCKVVKGITYIPIPAGSGNNFAGLFTIDLPLGIMQGQEFNVIVRRIASRRQDVYKSRTDNYSFENNGQGYARNWKYITGTFQVKIPVTTKAVMLQPEENILAIFKWRLQAMPVSNRWYPVLKRYIQYISARIDGLGGNASAIQPNVRGVLPTGKPEKSKQEYTGKVCEVYFNCYGDFEGFTLNDCCNEHKFHCREKTLGELILRACKEHLTITVVCDDKEMNNICKVIISC